MKISVVVPFYNTPEKMFDACLKSILQQTFSDFELIIVNDGSDDSYRKTLDNLPLRDERIKVVHKRNEGVSSARNCGVENAIGDFVTFVDSDDRLEPCFLEEAVQIQKEKDADIVIGGNVLSQFVLQLSKSNLQYECYSDEECKKLKQYFVGGSLLRFDNNGYFSRGPAARLIKIDIARQIPFDVRLHQGEDIVWNLQLLNESKSVCMAKRIWYVYTTNSGSATHKFNPNILKEVTLEMSCIKKYLDFNDDKEFAAFCGKLIDELKKSAVCYYNNVRDVNRDKHKVYLSEPWIMIKSERYLHLANRKYKLKALLYKYRLLFLAYKIHYVIKKGKIMVTI